MHGTDLQPLAVSGQGASPSSCVVVVLAWLQMGCACLLQAQQKVGATEAWEAEAAVGEADGEWL